MEMLGKKVIESRQMSQDLLKKFILMYRAHPNLWKSNSENYRNKALKAKSYTALIKLISSEIPNADRKFVAKKINTIRVCFRKEYRKWLENKDYKPMLWYYNLLSFIINDNSDMKITHLYEDDDSMTIFEPQIKIETSKLNLFECTRSTNELVERESDTEFEETLCLQSIDENDNEEVLNSSLKFQDEFLKNENVLESHSQYRISPANFHKISQLDLDEFETFGTFISRKLKKIASKNHDQYIFCENIINQAIMKAQLGKLNENSSITC